MQRFTNLNDKTDSVLLLTVDDRRAFTFSYANYQKNQASGEQNLQALEAICLNDLGSEEQRKKMPDMQEFDAEKYRIATHSSHRTADTSVLVSFLIHRA